MRAQEFLAEDEPVRIKIGGAEAAAKAKAWIERVYALYPQTMQNNHVMPLGGTGDDQQFAMFELVPSFSRRGAVEVKWFQAYPLRSGVGSRAMKELQALAREDGISLTLFPWDKGQVSQAKLTKFYRGQGFSPTVKGSKAMQWTSDQPGVAEDFLSEAWAFRNKNKIYQLLIDQTGSGPFDGGCVVFAQALQLKYGGDIVSLVGRTRPNGTEAAQHAALYLGGKLIDADGPAEPEQFVKRFVQHEMASDSGSISQVRPIQNQDLPEAPRDQDLADKIAKLL